MAKGIEQKYDIKEFEIFPVLARRKFIEGEVLRTLANKHQKLNAETFINLYKSELSKVLVIANLSY